MSNNSYLLLWLEAPLQSWGHDSKFGRRESLNFPTRSGILGLICCALGKGGEQKELLKSFLGLGQEVLSFTRQEVKEKPTLLRDFHMVGSGYNEKDKWENLHIPKKSDGGAAVGGGTKITYRYYLQDACFGVVFETPAEMQEQIIQALQNPVWDLYFGRKSCVPSELIYQGCYDSREKAEAQALALAEGKGRRLAFRVKEGIDPNGEAITLMDVPLQFGEHKLYRDRQVTFINEQPPNN